MTARKVASLATLSLLFLAAATTVTLKIRGVSHTFKFITPAMTDKYKIPSACTSCHKDKSTDWATQQLLSWKTLSPRRVAQR